MFDNVAYQRAYGQKLRDERRSNGLCGKCGKPAEKKSQCTSCREKDTERHIRKSREQAQSGICRMCNAAPVIEGNKQYCAECVIKARRSTKAKVARNRLANLCVTCSRPTDGKRVNCQECRDRFNRNNIEKRTRNLANGCCRECGQPAQISGRSPRGFAQNCQTCYLKMLARTVLGSGKLWQVLLDKLNECNWECHYTGEKLVLAVNASFDHLDPVTRFPERKFDPSNVVPCTLKVNFTKRDLTKEEFLTLVYQVNDRHRRGT